MSMKILRDGFTSIALKALDSSVSTVGKALSRIANGQKIVTAADNASQYAQSERMRNLVRDLNQSTENIQNDSTMLKIAEGAISSTLDIVRQMKEKAMMASDINVTDEERESLQKEVDVLIDQINENSRVQFNNKFLLDGASSPLYSNSYSPKELVARGLNSAWIRDSLNMIEDTFGLSFKSETARYRQMDVFLDDSFSSESDDYLAYVSTSANKAGTLELHVNMAYYNEIDKLDPNGNTATSGGGYLDRTIAHEMVHAIMISNIENFNDLPGYIREGGTAEIVHGADDTRDLLGAVGNLEDSYAGGVVAMRYMAYQTSEAPDDFIRTFMGKLADGWSLDSTIKHATHGAFSGQAGFEARYAADIEEAGSSEEFLKKYCGIILDNEDVGAISGSDAGRGATKSGWNAVREVSSPANWRLPSKPTTFINGLEINWQNNIVSGSDAGGGFQFQIGATVNDKMTVGLFNMSANALGLIDNTGKTLQVTTQGNAMEAARILENLVVTLLEHQADVGAVHQRVQFTTSNLEQSSDNIQAAESTIRDADMAKEMVELNRGKALEQASQSVLAQANQNSEKVLQVLSNDSAPIEVHANTIQAKHAYDENLSEVGRDLKQISSGEKVNDPTDGSSSYQIGESMRVKLRALEQDNNNVQTGSAILKVAQSTVETIVNDLTSLKEIAVNAANGYNNDTDRLVLQKNFDQLRDKINELVSQTTYNDNGLIDGRYQRYHMTLDNSTNEAKIHESLGLTVHHGTESGQSVRFYLNSMYTSGLGGANVRKEDLEALLNNRTFINSRNSAELEGLTLLQSQLEQMREDTSVLMRDENLQARLQGVFDKFANLDADSEEGSTPDLRKATMNEYLNVGNFEETVKNLDKYEFLKPMLEEELVVDALNTRLDAEGNAIALEEGEETEVAADIEEVEILKDAAGKSLSDAKLETIHDANVAMKIVESALNTALDEAANVGAYMARLDFTSQNIAAQIENTENMNSVIRDADMAKSMSKYMRDQMVTQASQSMLSQAINNPLMVLSFTQ